MALRALELDDKYTARDGRVFLTGTQALVRLALVQHARDRVAGLNTGGYISGYRGSPLGGLDQALVQARGFLDAAGIVFNPGVNEDLAATAILGTQQINLMERAKRDGVFAYWYGKGPGVDRSGDAFRHGNLAGSAEHGGVTLFLGDDHTCKSSTTSHQSEYAMVDAMIPVLNPSGIEEIIGFGLYANALSRFSGCWTGLKLTAETMDSSGSVTTDLERLSFVRPGHAELPPDGVNIRWPDTPQEQERRLHRWKLPAVVAFAQANRIDRVVLSGPERRFGIVTTGKSYLDVRQALEELGLDDARAQALGLSVYKVGMTWPLEPEGAAAFCSGLDAVLVVEEKRPLIEGQLKDILYHLDAARRPRIAGKRSLAGALQLPANDDLDPTMVARAIVDLLGEAAGEALRARAARMPDPALRFAPPKPGTVTRIPYFCSGCPHSTSTRVPEGSRAQAGIGCHYMAQWMDRSTAMYTQMGGEGANWIGQAPFVPTRHVFQNIGDGTYFHSGLLAIRAAVAAKVNVTYKILFNDAVAMTGGQRHDGALTPQTIAAQVRAEGVDRIAVVSDDIGKYAGTSFPPGTTIHHRDDLDEVQRELRDVPGTSVLVYDQTCAAEKRRRRKRGTMADPDLRIFIHEEVCEGCGDCSAKSNCLSVVPVETEFGTKRRIDQSSCNKDVSCVKGFCPSFVTVEGAALRRPAKADLAPLLARPLPVPATPALERPLNILVTGVGGTGVVTIGAVLAMAAHLEGKGATTLDMAGLAQKGGPVTSHVRLAASPDDIATTRIAAGGADLILACDAVVAGGKEARSLATRGRTRIVLNRDEALTADIFRDRDFRVPLGRIASDLQGLVGAEALAEVPAGRLASRLLGDAIGANMMMVGYAVQAGLVPISIEAIERAIELNGAAVTMNKSAFRLGRLLAVDPKAVEAALPAPAPALDHRRLSADLDEVIARRAERLAGYQNAAYAARYRDRVGRVRAAETKLTGRAGPLTDAVAKNLHKLMAIKDEYEVGRLYASPSFRAQLADTFSDWRRLRIHLAPPLLARPDPVTGEPRKMTFGPWMLRLMPLLAAGRRLRGTVLDVFGWTEERRAERRLLADYERLVDRLAAELAPERLDVAVALARLPEAVRGYGHVRAKAMAAAAERRAALEQDFAAPPALRAAAE